MSRDKANLIVLVLVVFILVFGYLNLSVKSDFENKKDEFASFQKSAKEIYLLKRLQKNKKAILNSFSSVKKPVVTDKRSSTIYEYNNLNIDALQSLLKRIQGSFLPIKKLEIKADTTNHATVVLEVAK